jgi:aldose 1-epimerase
MKITSGKFLSLPGDKQASLFHLENDRGISLTVTDYGCTILSLLAPGRDGKLTDIITGYSKQEDWLTNPAYFGCMVGRTCNRISNAKFTIDGTEYKVSANSGSYQLHGGFEGFHKKLWKSQSVELEDAVGIQFEYFSADGEEGFPGNLTVKVEYLLTNANEFIMTSRAVTDKATPVNLTNHTYFNLAGHDSGEVYKQELKIEADFITESNQDCIPTGKLLEVRNTPFDFTDFHSIGERINQLHMGYDDNFVLRNQSGELKLAVTVFDPVSGRNLEIFTTEPGVQLYTSNWFDGNMLGKGGFPYQKHQAFALETQHYPDSVNRPEFPSVITRPGQPYLSKTMWKFSCR